MTVPFAQTWVTAACVDIYIISPPPSPTPPKKNTHTQVITDKSQRQLVRELDASLPRYVLLDKIRFSQLIMNLTSNAAKVRKNE